MSNENITPEIETIIKQYEQLTAVSEVILGGNLHVGYWPEGHIDGPIQEATDRLTDLLTDKLDVQTGQLVLDVGCGTGRPALRLARSREVRVTGVDLSATHVEETIANADRAGLSDRVTAIKADAMELPLADEQVDAALACESLPHVADRVHALSEIRRVLRPGGRLVFTICVERRPVSEEVRRFLDDYYTTVNATYPPMETVPSMVIAAGLEVVSITDIGDKIFPTMEKVAKGFNAAATDLERTVGITQERTRKIADHALHFGALPESGYAVVVARRPLS